MKTNLVPLSGNATVVAKTPPHSPRAAIVAINQSGRTTLGGTSDRPSTTRSNYALRDLSEPSMTDAERSSAAGKFVFAFLSIWFLVPMILAGVMLHFR